LLKIAHLELAINNFFDRIVPFFTGLGLAFYLPLQNHERTILPSTEKPAMGGRMELDERQRMMYSTLHKNIALISADVWHLPCRPCAMPFCWLPFFAALL